MELAEIIVNDFGGAPVAEHNFPCPVCRTQKAVLHLNTGRFKPCWTCYGDGWRLIRKRSLWSRIWKSSGVSAQKAEDTVHDTGVKDE